MVTTQAAALMRLGLGKPLKTARFHFRRRTAGLKAGVNEKIPQLHPSF
jgi:hypothetical protein